MSPASSRSSIAFVVACAAALYLVGNARVSLWDRDEPRYAQASRQMLRSGDWVVPRFLDEVRTAKPVFVYWCQAASMSVIGDAGDAGVFAARLPSAVAMTGVLALLAVFVSRFVSREHALWTVLVFGSSVLTVWSAKACTTDAVLLAGVTVAQVCLYAIWRGRATWPVVIVLAVAVAQAGLTKGPVVLGVTGMTLLALGGLRLLDRWKRSRDRRRIPDAVRPPLAVSRTEASAAFRSAKPQAAATPAAVDGRLRQADDEGDRPLSAYREGGQSADLTPFAILARVVVGVAIVAALVGPWLVLVQLRESSFLGTSVSHDVLNRIARPLEGHRGPPGYHLALTFATFLPWSALLPTAIVFGFKHRADPRVRFALAAVLGPWVMFELVSTKLPHYMLPAFPPLAFLTADAVVRCLRGESDDLNRRAMRIGVGVVGLVFVGLGFGTIVVARRFGDPIWPAVAYAAATAAFAACVFTLFARRRPRAGLLALGGGVALTFVVLFAVTLPRADAIRLPVRVAEILRQQPGAGAPGASAMLDFKEPSLAYYQGGEIREHNATTLSHALLETLPPWLVITDDVWQKAPPDVRGRLEVVGTARGVAYADGAAPTVIVVRQTRGE